MKSSAPTRSKRPSRCWTPLILRARRSVPRPCSPSAASPAIWSRSARRITISPSKATSRDFSKPWSSTSRIGANRISWSLRPPITDVSRRKIWITTELNGYLDFPHVGQAFVIERHSTVKKTGATSLEIAYGLTSRTPAQARPQRVLQVNRGQWTIENSCHYILDWNYDEDRSRIRTGHGPENITRLRRFAIGVIKSRGARSVAQKMRQLTRNVRLVFDYLRMSENSCACGSQN